VNQARILPVSWASRRFARASSRRRDRGPRFQPARGRCLAGRDLEDGDALSTGATDTELNRTALDDSGFAWGAPRRSAASALHTCRKSSAATTRFMWPCRGSRRGGARTRGARYRRVARGVQRLCCAAIAAAAAKLERTPGPTPPTTPATSRGPQRRSGRGGGPGAVCLTDGGAQVRLPHRVGEPPRRRGQALACLDFSSEWQVRP
jgi:hypothetical protein